MAGSYVFLSEALIGEPVGIAETEDDGWHAVYYGPVFLARLDPSGTLRKDKRRQPVTREPPTGNV